MKMRNLCCAGLGLSLLAGCATQPLEPADQAEVYRAAVTFVQAHAIAGGCDALALDGAAVVQGGDALMARLGDGTYTRADIDAYLAKVPPETLGAAAREQLAAKGVVVEDLRNPAQDPALCDLGARERAQDTAIGGLLTDA